MEDTNTPDVLIVTDPAIEQECSELARAIAPLVLQDLQLGVPAEDTPHGRALTAAVYKAVDQLEGQGARSMRIACQLLEALARYELALGELSLELDPPATKYRVEWCNWVDGFEEHQQEWKSGERLLDDEYEANTWREALNARFSTTNIRHRVVEVKS
jgi:hypothetical protein